MNFKKIQILITVLWLSVLGCRHTASVKDVEKTKQGSILIDGHPDDAAWKYSDWSRIGNLRYVRKDPPSPENFSGYYKALWDEQYCYFLFKIVDNKKFVLVTRNEIEQYYDLKVREMDGAELFFDAGGQGKEINYLRFTYHTDTLNTSKTLQNNAFRKQVRFAQMDFREGYFIEVALPWELLDIQASPGLKLGFETNIYDNDGSTEAGKLARVQNILAWSDTAGINPSSTRANYGVLRLKDSTRR